MCKAKQRLQAAHGYIPGGYGEMPTPGTFITALHSRGEYVQGVLRALNPIGIAIRTERADHFIPWPAVKSITWETPEAKADAAAHQ